MKKLLLTLLAASGLFAAQATAPAYVWNKLIDSPKQQDMTRGMTVTSDGNVVTIGNFGSNTATDNISFDGEVIATGAATESSSENLNLIILKQNAADGSKIWAVSSKKGDISSMGRTVITATPDGGVAALICLRSSKTTPYENPVLVDASGAEVELLDWNFSEWIKYQTLIKISKDGIIQWVRPIIADQLPVPNASSGNSVNVTTDAGVPGAILTDDDGNIYIGGNYRAPLVFTGAQNSAFILTARNLETYNGDVQNLAGGFYLVKLNSEGHYLNHLRATSTGLTGDQIYDMQLSDGKIYFAGNLRGAEKATLTVGKSNSLTLEKKTSKNSLMLGAVYAADFKPVFLTCYDGIPTTTSNAGTIKFMKMTISGSNVYLMGALNRVGLAPNGSTETFVSVPANITLQRAFIAKVSGEDGAPVSSYMPSDLTGISEFEYAFEYDGKLYAVAYLMNANTGTFVDEINPSDFTLSKRTVLLNGASPTLNCAAFDAKNQRLFSVSRGNNSFTVGDGLKTDKPQSWGSVVTCHSFAETGAINGVENDTTLTVTGETGAVVVNATEATEISVVDMQGRLIDKRTVAAGETRIPLAAGFYLVNSMKISVK